MATPRIAAAEQMNRLETLYHVLKTRTGKVAVCGHVVEADAERVDATHVPREVRCGSAECQAVFQIPERAMLEHNAGLLGAIVEGDAYLEDAARTDAQASDPDAVSNEAEMP